MALPLNPLALAPALRTQVALGFTVTPSTPDGLVLDQTQVHAWVWAQEPGTQALLTEIRRRSQAGLVEIAYPDHRPPCSCGPNADDIGPLKNWDGDPAWCPRKDGPITAPTARYDIACADLTQLWWPDLFVAARALLRGYLAHPPAADADPETCALWVWRVLELCSAMGTASNVSPAVFNAFRVDAVGADFQPRIPLHVVDSDVRDASRASTDRNATVHVWTPTRADGSPAYMPSAAPPHTAQLPPPPARVAALWDTPAPAGVGPDQWFGGRRPTPFWNADGLGSTEGVNWWLDQAMTPAYLKSLWALPATPDGRFNSRMLPEWVCTNSRTRAWMAGDMSPWRAGIYRWDGATAWPSDAMAGEDPRTWISTARSMDGYSQISALFRAMAGRRSAPGWVFYREWYWGSNALSGEAPYQREQLGPGEVPGAWFYLDAAYRWGQWFAEAEYTTVVNSALYYYALVYLPTVSTRLARNHAGLSSPAQVSLLASQVQHQMTLAAASARSVVGQASSLLATVTQLLATTGVGMIAAAVLQIVNMLAGALADLSASQQAADALVPIFSPMIRVAVDPSCQLDVGAGGAAIQAALPVAAGEAQAALTSFMTQAQAHASATGLDTYVPAPASSTGAKVALGALALAAGVAIVLALRKR